MTHKTILIVLDGVGEEPDYPGNAVTRANTPFLDQLYKTYPWTLVEASGNAVGVPEGMQGASDPGHLSMGAGRVIFQPYEEINQAIKNGSFFENPAYLECLEFVKKNNGTLHLLGMISDGGVHAHISHLFALLELAKRKNVKNVLIHGFTDGRDVPERSALTYIQAIKQKTKDLGLGTLATLIGRYYLDRDNNHDRTQKAYNLLVQGEGDFFINAEDALQDLYQKKSDAFPTTDYYLPPTKLLDQHGFIHQGDGVIFFDYRSDRERDITAAFAGEGFSHFPTRQDVTVPNIRFVCTGPYSDTLPVAFPPQPVRHNVGAWIAEQGLKQLRIAETEKYAHVTFFFNSQVETPNPSENRILIPSPKVASYAEKPEMSAPEITAQVLPEIQSEQYDFILINFANGDLVGHSGVVEATQRAMEVLDECLTLIVPIALEHHYRILLTADHGNAEHMLNTDGSANPSHTLNPVRAVLITPANKKKKLKQGLGLSSVGTTVIKMLGLKQPPEMDAPPLF